MLKFISLEESFEIYEATFSVTTIGDTVHNEVYIVSPNIGDIDELMKKCERISTFLITALDGGDLIFSEYKLEEIYPRENEDEIVIIFTKEG